MSPSDFLRQVWGPSGFYCLVRAAKPGAKPTQHLVFSSIDDVEAYIARGVQKDLYFNILTLVEEKVWDATKKDYKTGEPGAWTWRKQTNMLAGRALFLDLDVGEGDHKYPTAEDARNDLDAFCTRHDLPPPTVVSSGGGWHVYWLLTAAIPAREWKHLAVQFRKLVDISGLIADPSRIEDMASILRVPGSYHCKNPDDPRLVKIVDVGTPTDPATLTQLISDAAVREGVTVTRTAAPLGPAPTGWASLGSNTHSQYSGPVPELLDVGNACALVKAMFRTKGDLPEPTWYNGIVGLGAHMRMGKVEGDALVQMFSQAHPSYTFAETEAKLAHHRGATNAPTSCAKLAQLEPFRDQFCKVCPHFGRPGIPNPLVASTRTTPAPAPVVTPATPAAPAFELPDPPMPFMRLKDGGIARKVKTAEDEEITEIIYPHDLYPLSRLVNKEADTEQQLWRVHLPRGDDKDFTIPADALYDIKTFARVISNRGIYPHKSQLGNLQEYMVAYISALQLEADADTQRSHLGWIDDFSRFVLPDLTLKADGTALTSCLTDGARTAVAQVYRKGGLLTQVELLKFYADPVYVGHQFLIVCALAAPWFHHTGHFGAIVNASGESGCSKSTALAAASSMWGSSTHYMLNGNADGATTRARNEKITTFANLPVCVDEITNMHYKEMQALALNVSQAGHRLRLKSDGTEKAGPGNFKSTLMLCTANTSLHAALAHDNPAGTAGSMRVFEMRFQQVLKHSKAEADDFLWALRHNFGHIGPAFLERVISRDAEVGERIQSKVREIDRIAQIQPHERYHSAVMGAALAIGELAASMGLLPYDMPYMQKWLIERQLPVMRDIVVEEYAAPLTVLTDYMEHVHANILVVTKEAQIFPDGRTTGAYHLAPPRGALLGHYDQPEKLMILLKRGFKDYCTRIGANATQLLSDLHDAKIVTNTQLRRTLGAGTEMAKGQSWCFVVDMSHPDIAATLDYKPGAAPRKPNLSVVT